MIFARFWVYVLYLNLIICFLMTQAEMVTPVVLVHGGAGDISDDRVPAKIAGVERAVQAGYEALQKGLSSLDAAQAAVESMEDDPAFNAGYGSVLNLDGEVEMDAILMEGSSLQVGSVGGVRRIKHPIALARLVMEKSPHAILMGEGANRFAEEQGVKSVPAYQLVTQSAIDALENFINGCGKDTFETGREGDVGTVGAVIVDQNGHVAVATSTGGTTGKLPGRIGDTPIPGSGGYADDNIGAVSTTGKGESILRVCLAHRILNLMEQGKSATEATADALHYMGSTVGDTAGAITVSNKGDIGIYFISNRMAWAYKKGNDSIVSGIDTYPSN